MRTGWKGAGLSLGMLLAATGSALADTKSGVDAWRRGDYKRAVEEWRPLAIAGDVDAQFDMGQAYKLGRGVPLDPALAQSWFLKAAQKGHLQAADSYGLALFEDGKRAEAAPWLEKSAARFEPRAQLVLGTMLFNGDGVTRDYPRAYALMTRASQQGMKSAADSLAQMDQYISPADRQQGVALADRYAAEQNAAKLAAAGSPAAGPEMVDAGPAVSAVAPRAAGRVPTPPASSRTGARVPLPMAETRREPAPAAVAHRPSPPVASPASGRWKVQLGAFREEGNARALWSSVAGRLPGARPIYATAGGVTRLQAGPFAGKAEAQRACAATRQSCVVVAP